MILEHAAIAIANGKRMLSSHHKLVGVTWMLVVMDQTGNEGSKIVMFFQTLLDITLLE